MRQAMAQTCSQLDVIWPNDLGRKWHDMSHRQDFPYYLRRVGTCHFRHS